MRRLSTAGWAILVSLWAGIVGGAVIREPTVDLVPAYAVGCQVVALLAAYWTMRRHDDILASAHRPGRVALFILALFFVTVPLTILLDLLLGHSTPLGIAAQWLAYLLGLGTGLYVSFAGGFDRAWAEYT
ncbi:hypothetical protein [Haloarcula salina]|uniref:Uncharacterized protein n=1 Tax=Haloarcula salina TaxID=1429914 RepID=A0AA41G4X8_9EURY|nr:hypothetical protein [Haloarcula salina]MBV0903676.1 hypothetical protein [Haloarcula salina]